MTITYTDCSSVTVASNNLLVNNQEVTLTVKHNCTTEYVLDIVPSAQPIVVTPALLSMTDVITDGIYYFHLKVIKVDNSITNETACLFVDCNTTCQLLDVYKTNDSDRTIAFLALLASKDCEDCNCNHLCLLYNTAITEPCVDTHTNTTSDVEPCNC